MILVDTNVLLDIYKVYTLWMLWSVRQLRSAKPGQLAINMVVYAELAAYPIKPGQTDFFIGAHAETEKYKLLTRDAGRYKTYFPKIKLICP